MICFLYFKPKKVLKKEIPILHIFFVQTVIRNTRILFSGLITRNITDDKSFETRMSLNCVKSFLRIKRHLMSSML